MNILLWYLPFAMFTETCDLIISECKAPTQAKPGVGAMRARRPVAPVAARQR
jgi:hypothetical protein